MRSPTACDFDSDAELNRYALENHVVFTKLKCVRRLTPAALRAQLRMHGVMRATDLIEPCYVDRAIQ